MSAFNLSTCARPNILKLVPYRCARDDYKDDGTNILLDANENAFGPSLPSSSSLPTQVSTSSLHRYPDPHQIPLKQLFCNLRNSVPASTPPPTNPAPSPIKPENLFLGVGSDEAIDILLRAFCIPGKDSILVCPPTYGMYSVSAAVNDVGLVKIPLRTDVPGFPLDTAAILDKLSSDEAKNIKLIYICSPGNPTGSLINPLDIAAVLAHPTWNGVVIVDEAYIDFSVPGSSLSTWVTAYPNLVVMQTLSKAFGLAGIRLGAAFTSVPIAAMLNALKAPYSVSSPTSEIASVALADSGEGGLAVYRKNVAALNAQRDRLRRDLREIEGTGEFKGGFEANFLLIEMLDKEGRPSNQVAKRVYEMMAEERGVVVRFRGNEWGCEGCLRITVGTEAEVGRMLERLAEVLKVVRG